MSFLPAKPRTDHEGVKRPTTRYTFYNNLKQENVENRQLSKDFKNSRDKSSSLISRKLSTSVLRDKSMQKSAKESSQASDIKLKDNSKFTFDKMELNMLNTFSSSLISPLKKSGNQTNEVKESKENVEPPVVRVELSPEKVTEEISKPIVCETIQKPVEKKQIYETTDKKPMQAPRKTRPLTNKQLVIKDYRRTFLENPVLS